MDNVAASGVQPAIEPAPSFNRVTESRANRGRTAGIVACIVGGALGAGVGLGMSYFYKQQGQAPVASRELPGKGLVILTAQPYSSFQIASDGRRFITGKTGKDGDVSLPDIDPKNYHLKVVAADGQKWESDVTVSSDAPAVVGGESELFSGAGKP